jgi:hypothetical protein
MSNFQEIYCIGRGREGGREGRKEGRRKRDGRNK